MHGGFSTHIVRRGGDSVTVASSVNWSDIVQKLSQGARHSTQRVLGPSRAITLRMYYQHPVSGSIPLEDTAVAQGALYYRVDATQPTIASNFNPVTENWLQFTGQNPSTFVVNPGNWVTFGVAENSLPNAVPITLAVKNATKNLELVDEFVLTYYVSEPTGGGSSSSNSSTTSGSSGGGNSPPPPEDP